MRFPPSSCPHSRFLLLSIFAASILGGPQGCGGGGSNPSAVVAPSKLVYPQANITATVGTAIPDDIPTVTGTVDSYAVSPTLPVGLNLNGSTGSIFGTPTSVVAQATYAVTARNSAGATSTNIQVAVNSPVVAPSKLVYPQANITAMVGTAIPTDIPTVTGTVDSYAVSPILPTGLNLNRSTGAIFGTPTGVTASASYTVTANNSGGSTTAVVNIVVNKSLAILDLGHARPLDFLKLEKSRLLSRDDDLHWALWDYDSGSQLANGDQFGVLFSNTLPTLALAGSTVVIGLPNGLEVRSSSDGHLLSTIVSPNLNYSFTVSTNSWWNLATDGSYICSGSQSALSVWLPNGLLVVTRPGDYSKAKSFAAPSEIRIALGPAGENVVETISIADGTSSIGPTFSGIFNSWFLDGERFLTNVSNTVWTYSKTGIQQSLVTMATVENLTGQGDWVWTYDSTNLLNIYAIGNTSPAATYSLGVLELVKASGMTIGAIPYGSPAISVIDLSGSSPTKVDHDLPIAYGTAYAATSASQWVVGNLHGVVLDGARLSSTPRYFGLGQVWSIAGADNRVGIAVASGKILLMDPNGLTLEGTIDFPTSKLELSADGSVLAAMANANDDQSEPDRTLKVFSIPTGSLINSWPYTQGQDPFLIDFSLSRSGTIIGQVLRTSVTPSLIRQVAALTGGPTIWSDSLPSQIWDLGLAIHLSPDGTLIAVSGGPPDPNSGTRVIKNGTLITAVPGEAVGWIDDNRLLADNYVPTLGYSGSAIYDSTGVKLASPSLPELKEFQAVTSDLIYSPYLNTIFSLPSGSPAWKSTIPAYIVGAVSGPYVVFLSGNRLLVDSY